MNEGMTQIGKLLIIVGCIIAVVGALLYIFPKIPFIGKLPGDISIKKENFELYIPLGTSILLSLLISGILWLIQFLGKK